MSKGKYIYGRYVEVKSPNTYMITRKDIPQILKISKRIMEVERKCLKEKWIQGFILMYPFQSIMEYQDVFYDLENYLTQGVKSKISLAKYLDTIYQKMTRKYTYSNMKPVIKKTIKDIEAAFLLSLLPDNEPLILKIPEPTIALITLLNKHVEVIVYDEKPNYLILKAMEAKNIYPFELKAEFNENMTYCLDITTHTVVHDLGQFYPPKKNVKKMHLDRYKIGLEIHNLMTLDHEIKQHIDFIVIEMEKVMIRNDGYFCFKKQQSFYQEIFKVYHDIPIIIVFPRLDLLYHYYHLERDTLMDDQSFLYHKKLIDEILDLSFKYGHEQTKLVVSSISEPNQYKFMDDYMKRFGKRSYQKTYKIGNCLENEVVFENIKEIKGFSFGLIDLERLYDEIHISEDTTLKVYKHDLGLLRDRMKIRKKPLILSGSMLNDEQFFLWAMRHGFTHFVVNSRHLLRYRQILYAYEEKRWKNNKKD